MLKILPIESKDTQKEIAAVCGVEYIEEALAYSAYSDEALAGIAQFRMTDKGALLYEIGVCGKHVETDYQILFTLGRAALNFVDLCGVHDAFYVGNIEDESLILDIGFEKSDRDEYYMNLEGFFTSGGSCGCKG